MIVKFNKIKWSENFYMYNEVNFNSLTLYFVFCTLHLVVCRCLVVHGENLTNETFTLETICLTVFFFETFLVVSLFFFENICRGLVVILNDLHLIHS